MVPTDVAARAACLAALVSDQGGRAAQLVLEQDDSLVRSDRLAWPQGGSRRRRVAPLISNVRQI